MAGLSLAFYLNKSFLRDKQILIIDREAKDKNDHTWCFWQKEESAFEEKVFHRWKTLWFHGTDDFSALLNLGGYEYKMIRALDFYEHTHRKLSENKNITFLRSDIQIINSENEGALVVTGAGEFFAKEFVFDSFTRKNYDNPKYQNLWQHFAGWEIETEDEVFNPNEPTLFDFRVEQKGECRFIYILPFSANKALIELTVFSENILEKSEYEFYLKKYISEILKVKNYKIAGTENGIIPMSDEPHEQNPSSKVIRIGTAGGYVKPSTGYSFARAQRSLQNLVKKMELRQPVIVNQPSRWKLYLDSVLLDVLRTDRHPAADVFTQLFKRNKTTQVLKFLDEDTELAEDLRIMQSVPLLPFVKSAIDVASRKIGA